MERFLGFGKDHVDAYHARTSNQLFVRLKRKKVPLPQEEDEGKDNEAKEEEGVPEKVSK